MVVACATIVILPQLAMYRHATGQWLASPYGPDEWFDFSSPKILEVLFSTQKGLFFWSPLLLLFVAATFGLAAAQAVFERPPAS